MFGLTKQQRIALNFITRYIKRNGYSPSYSEIGEELELSGRASIMRLVNCLEERGAIRKLEGRHRSIEIVK